MVRKFVSHNLHIQPENGNPNHTRIYLKNNTSTVLKALLADVRKGRAPLMQCQRMMS